MAKGQSKKATGIPKTVAGVRIPKAVRKSSSLGTLLNSDLGREILADALIAAAGAAAAALTRTRTARAAGEAVADASGTAANATGDLVQTAAGAVAEVVTDAARNFLPTSLIGGSDERPRYLNKASNTDSRKRSKKVDGSGKSTAKKRKKKG